MKTVITTVEDNVKKVNVEYTITEWLIVNKALTMFITDVENNPEDRAEANKMLRKNKMDIDCNTCKNKDLPMDIEPCDNCGYIESRYERIE